MDKTCCSVAEFEAHAFDVLDHDVMDYFQGGATSEQTLCNNRKAFTKLRLRPLVMKDVSERDSSLVVLGRRHRCPVGISPTAMQKLAKGEGEVGTARAAASMDAIMILSILSTTSLEEVREKNPEATLWMQVYIFKERNLTLDLVQRAEAAGYEAVVLTMDTPVLGSRYRDLKNTFTMPTYLTLENFRNRKQKSEELSTFRKPSGQCATGLTDYISKQFDDSVTWEDVRWLVNATKLPIICKGIVTGQDAVLCYQSGAKGIIVSNHGGRQLDQTPATIEALPEVVQAVGDQMEVYMDGGVRYGTDVFKAIGLGAKYVFAGRAILYGLTHSGFKGVLRVLQIYNFEFDQTLALCGCRSARDITSDMIVHKRYYEHLVMSTPPKLTTPRGENSLRFHSRSEDQKSKRRSVPREHKSQARIGEPDFCKGQTKLEKEGKGTIYERQKKQRCPKKCKIKSYIGFKSTPETRKQKSKSPRNYSYVFNKNFERRKNQPIAVQESLQQGDLAKKKSSKCSSPNNVKLKAKRIPSSQKKVRIISPFMKDSDSCGDNNRQESPTSRSCESKETFCDGSSEGTRDSNRCSCKVSIILSTESQKSSCSSDTDTKVPDTCTSKEPSNHFPPDRTVKIRMTCSKEREEDKCLAGQKRNFITSSLHTVTSQLPKALIRRVRNRF